MKPRKNTDESVAFKPLSKLGIIAGGGALPMRLIQHCRENDIDFMVIAFEGQTDPGILDGTHFMLTRLGAAGRIIDTLKANNIVDLVLIGALRRPGLQELRPDWRTFRFFTKVGVRALGDDGLLKALRGELESEGFTLHGVHNFIPALLATDQTYTTQSPKKSDWVNIKRGIEVSQLLGRADIGQSVIIQEGIVIGVEAIEGTDALIQRCATLQRKGRGGVLVKSCKPQQDKDLDLPTVGVQTIHNAVAAGLRGLVVDVGKTLMIDPQDMVAYADAHKFFIMGIDMADFKKSEDVQHG
jgi:DUF1009 family protein